ncbi:MAG: bifunctional 4-hydroxy-2-oxoglutarate aldolase/2-dehydro-3-deoxy-phosphogluconate aldolase, partial [Anaerolineaceae bacterium]|nr:bifunctional 4-hydroxy-2-oxoglutarate aldolase/2-dehydro-3-deoxy-phosphogluconate aldolase [Anaerolineaceae bacterium]
ENEISNAEEMGAEICKVFPGEAAGGPGFIKVVMAPCPWHRLLPTGGVDASEASISEWIKAGASGVGLGSKLISSQAMKEKDYESIAQKTADCVKWVKAARK